MCLAVVALGAHPRFPLVVVANRDEFHARPAAPAAWWPEGILAGRDLAAGGTWLGVTPAGRFAFLTNVRDPAHHDPAAPSRGTLVPAALADPASPAETVARVRASGLRHNGFNLVAGDPGAIAWASNRDAAVRGFTNGVHGISNGHFDDRWPKVQRTMHAVADWAAAGVPVLEPLFVALADRTLAPDRELPSTGVTLEWERALSAVFIAGERYGTRCSTVLAVDHGGNATFVERSFAPDGGATGEVVERFALVAQRSGRSITM